MLNTRTYYLLGTGLWAVSMVGALFGLTKSLESRLFHEVQTRLAEAELKGFDVHINGQAVHLGLRSEGLKIMGIHQTEALNRAVANAKLSLLSLDGGIFAAGHRNTPVTGPITKLTFDEAALASARLEFDAPPTAQEIVVAASCTQKVTDAVGQRKLNFISDSAQLTPDSEAILNDIYTAITSCPEKLDLYVEGYTDNSGTLEHNLKLSQERAAAAASALIAKGLKAEEVHAAGFGADKPIASNAEAEGQARNRRVEFILRPR